MHRIISFLLVFIAAALAATSRQLDSTNYKHSIASGTWLIEHYSPTCSHCIAFEPTWDRLINKFGQDVHFGQVDCTVSKDICAANDVKATPTLALFKEGQLAEHYAGSNAYKDLSNYLQSHLISMPNFSDSARPNSFGQVVELSDSNIKDYIGEPGEDKLVWIKYFAPWCPHCQHLAPVWEELAARFKGRLTIASVDCDQHHKLCQHEKIRGYPTLVMYSDTQKKIYKGGRSLEKMAAFGEKVLEPGLRDIMIDEFEKAAAKEEVFYLFLHSPLSSTNHDSQLLDKARGGFIGGPTIYRSKDDRLFDKYNVNPTEGSVFLAFKDYDWNIPASKVKLADLGSLKDDLDDTILQARVKELTEWLRYNSFPTVVDAATIFNELLNSDTQQYLVILPLEPGADDFESSKNKLADIARAWRKGGRSMMTDEGFLQGGPGSSTIFAWVDAKKYNRWLRNMYGYVTKSYSKEAEHRQQVIIADPLKLEYYDKSFDGQPTILDGHSIFSALEGVFQGQLKPKSSQNAFEYTIQALHNRITSMQQSLIDHPFRTFIVVMLIALGAGIAIYMMSGDADGSTEDSLHLFSSGTAGKSKGSARDYYQPTHKDNRRID